MAPPLSERGAAVAAQAYWLRVGGVFLVLLSAVVGIAAGLHIVTLYSRARPSQLLRFSSATSSGTSSAPAGGVRAAADCSPAVDASSEAARAAYLFAALAPLIPREGHDVMAIERMTDLMLQAGSLSGAGGARDGLVATRVAPRMVQVGANDGGASPNDPIWHRINASDASALDAVLVEPVPHLFKAMSQSYERLLAERRARFGAASAERFRVHPLWGAACPPDSGATKTFYSFWANASLYKYISTRDGGENHFPTSAQQVGSFSGPGYLAHNTNARVEDVLLVMATTEVPCTSLRAIMCERGWGAGTVDYFHVDAEGADYQVLLAADLEVTRPRVIRFEAQHLDADTVEKWVQSVGYHTVRFKANGVAEILGLLISPPPRVPQRLCKGDPEPAGSGGTGGDGGKGGSGSGGVGGDDAAAKYLAQLSGAMSDARG